MAILWIAAGVAAAQTPYRGAVEPFEKNVDAYVALRFVAATHVSKPAVSSDSAAIGASVDALADAIRAARAHAQVGDMFAPPIASALLRRIDEVLTRNGMVEATELLAEINREAPTFPAELTVNGRFDWRYGARMPADLIEALPSLPEFLQYRFVNRDLVLVDVEADLIVDVLPDALW